LSEKNKIRIDNSSVKGTIDEKIYDVIYYAIAIANCYDIDLEKNIKDKEKINAKKYNSDLL
jgi:NTP pyrophosphatase (non-canonical NTP hydrolase)